MTQSGENETQSGESGATSDARSGESERFARTWLDASGAVWTATVDRLSMSCGACDVTRYLHIDAPDGARWTFTLAPDASLEGVSDAALEQLVRDRTSARP